MGFPYSSAGKESACSVGYLDSIPGLGGSPEEGKGYPLQYSGLENFIDCIKEISPGCSLEGMMLKLKLQYFGHLMRRVDSLEKRLPWWLRWFSICLQRRRPGFDSWVGKIPWRRKWQSTPGLLPGKSHGQRSLIGYSPWGRKKSDMTE